MKSRTEKATQIIRADLRAMTNEQLQAHKAQHAKLSTRAKRWSGSDWEVIEAQAEQERRKG